MMQLHLPLSLVAVLTLLLPPTLVAAVRRILDAIIKQLLASGTPGINQGYALAFCAAP
jgi:hypothetical protein